ncbi:hypothetical protein Dimus_001690 [Dionaea muscipula]
MIQLEIELIIEVRVCHYPQSASKQNKLNNERLLKDEPRHETEINKHTDRRYGKIMNQGNKTISNAIFSLPILSNQFNGKPNLEKRMQFNQKPASAAGDLSAGHGGMMKQKRGM